ncbi:uncharacterized protein LOC131327567 [Rhododendron vialii]|uniref:uncharacterized protein LOC131327567 n=1 Tax=Rhododendron vialii TaxID=182163 RepID=UPI00265FD377|nr:uncharacterized protein LOC131327567 [Rhododendron vialii]
MHFTAAFEEAATASKAQKSLPSRLAPRLGIWFCATVARLAWRGSVALVCGDFFSRSQFPSLSLMTHLHSPAQQLPTSLGFSQFPTSLISISTSRFIAGGFAEIFHPPKRQGMDAQKNAYFTNLLQDGLILDDELSMEPQDEVGFTYANQNAEEFTQASQTSAQMGSTSKKPQRGGNFTDEEDKLLVSA